MSWKETLEAVPWASYPSPDGASPNLLVKIALARGPQLGLIVLVTDLIQVYIEEVTTRVITQRLQRAINESQDTQSQNTTALGVGEEGERELGRATEDLVASVQGGQAEVKFMQEGFDSTLFITLPSTITVQFVLDPLERESAAVLSAQLITPLLGLSASLLGLLKDEFADASTLVAKVQGAIDGSGTSEYNQSGRACNTLFRIGGSSMLKRWAEKAKKGPRAKEFTPVALSQAAVYTIRASSSSATASHLDKASPSPSSSVTAGKARQMLDHKQQAVKGEAVSWEETQELASTSAPSKDVSPLKSGRLPSSIVLDQHEEDEEPPTEEDEPASTLAPPAAQPRSSPLKRPASSMLHHSSPPINNPALPTALPDSQAQTQPQEEPGAIVEMEVEAEQEEEEEDTEAKAAERAREQKRLAKEQEEQDEMENRKTRLAARAKSQASRGAVVKKKRAV